MTPTDHPGDDRLGDYVSGSLTAPERPVVARHLETCTDCAREVAEASAARGALTRLETVQAPPGLAAHSLAAGAASDATGGSPPDAPTGTPRWYRWGGAAAVAAAFALVLILVLPRFGAKDASTAPGLSAARGPVTVEVSGENFQRSSLPQLAADFAAGHANAGAAEATNGLAVPAASSSSPQAFASAAKVGSATACVKKAFRDVDGTLGRVIQARFEGAPAYLALYTEPSMPDQPAGVTVRVAAIDGCTPLSIAHAAATP